MAMRADHDDDEEAKDRPLMLTKPTINNNFDAYRATIVVATSTVAH